MPKTPYPVELDAEKSLIKITPVRLIALISAVVVLSNMASNKLSAMASDEDVDERVAAHAQHPHASTASRLDANEIKNAIQDTQLAELKLVPQQIGAVNAKLDALILVQLELPGQPRDSMRAAARKVRSKARARAGSLDDPLRTIEGL